MTRKTITVLSNTFLHNTGCGELTSFFEYEYTHIKKEVSLLHPV
jgi:hypothetical protein